MKKIPRHMLETLANSLPEDVRDEMAIPSYLHKNPLFRAMAFYRLEVLCGFLKRIVASNENQPMTIVDYGCGTGMLFEECNQFADKIYGVDLVIDAARTWVSKANIEGVTLLHPEEMQNQIELESVDIIIAAEVLEHVDEPEMLISQFLKLLRPNGHLVVSLPSENPLYRLGRRLAGFKGHYHLRDGASINQSIVSNGFLQTSIRKIPLPGFLSIYWVIDYVASSAR